jgi:hypothetical protein
MKEGKKAMKDLTSIFELPDPCVETARENMELSIAQCRRGLVRAEEARAFSNARSFHGRSGNAKHALGEK